MKMLTIIDNDDDDNDEIFIIRVHTTQERGLHWCGNILTQLPASEIWKVIWKKIPLFCSEILWGLVSITLLIHLPFLPQPSCISLCMSEVLVTSSLPPTSQLAQSFQFHPKCFPNTSGNPTQNVTDWHHLLVASVFNILLIVPGSNVHQFASKRQIFLKQ